MTLARDAKDVVDADIARFAAITADLAEPFGDRPAVLARHGIPAPAWSTLRARIVTAMRTSPDARATFQRAYALARAANGHQTPAPPGPGGRSEDDPDVTRAPISEFGQTLPFRGRVDAAPTTATPTTDASGETVAIGAPQDGVRFRGAAMVDLLKLERYAELAVELRLAPTKASEILAAHGLTTEDERRQIHALWRMRFESNPVLQQRFDQIVAKKLASLRSGA